ncbi:hypothetical protein [Streptomyces natalensis]|uniref:Uncharacterized protein n=1 Tax=Streptomyces natalensis ATCC 27448 TaxID=1240678 RepID=A0A0D7CFB1_9ACTN|nr:hypothetical protein [Streptomyces natalensis]KIZ14934.1 hypothetical protein SNA_30050 [Streptomyces natalensis ATCC 27448]
MDDETEMEEDMSRTIQTVSDALPRDVLVKHDYKITGEAAESHGSTLWTWHHADPDTGLRRHVSLAIWVEIDGSIRLVEFWAGASHGRRFVRECIVSRPMEMFRLHKDLEDAMQQAVSRAEGLTDDDLINTRPFSAGDGAT